MLCNLHRGTAMFLLFSFVFLAVPIVPASAAIQEASLRRQSASSDPANWQRAEQALKLAGITDTEGYHLDKLSQSGDVVSDSLGGSAPEAVQSIEPREARFQNNPQDVPEEPQEETSEAPEIQKIELPEFPQLPDVAQEPPPPEELTPEERRSRNQLPLITFPSECLDVATSKWNRVTHHGAQYRDVTDDPFCYATDDSIVYLDVYDNIANPSEETIVWDFISPVAERNMTARGSAASVQFHYVSEGELTLEAGPEYNLEVTVWDRRSLEGQVIGSAGESSSFLRDVLDLQASVSARDPGVWTVKRSRNGDPLPDESFEVRTIPSFPVDYAPSNVGTFVDGNYRNPDGDYVDSDEFVVVSEEYQLQNLLVDRIPEGTPEPVDPEAEWPQQAEIFWHWYSPNTEDNVTKYDSYLTVHLLYRENKAGTRYTLVERISDSRYKGSRIRKFVQQTDQPLLDDYTLTYGAGLPTEGTWNLKRVINGTETDLTNPAVTAFGNLSPQCDDSPNPPEVVEIIPPSTNVDLSGDYTYVINYPEAENLTSPYTPEGRTIFAGVSIRDAKTNQVYTQTSEQIQPGSRFQRVRGFGSSDIPFGSVVYAVPFIYEDEILASKADPSSRPDYRIAEAGVTDGPISDADSHMTVAQIVDIGNPPAPRRVENTGQVYGQQVLPSAQSSRQWTPIPGSIDREVDQISGQTRITAHDLVIQTVGLPIVISRAYNPSKADRLPSRGWTYSYERYLSVPYSDSSITYNMPDGTSERFEWTDDGKWEASLKSSMAGAVIEELNATDYQITYKSKNREIFSRPLNGYPYEALLKQEIDKNGNANTYTWNATGTQIVSLTDPIGREVTFNWIADRLPGSITDWTGRSIQYTYQNTASGGLLLRRVLNADGEPVVYQYARDLRRSLSNPNRDLYQIVATKTPAGFQERVTTSNARGALGVLDRAVTSQGTYTRLTQTAGGANRPLQTVRLSMTGTGATQNYTTQLDEFVQPVSVTNPINGNSSFTWTDNSRLQEFVNAKNQSYQYTWDEAGNPLTMEDPRGITTTFTWDEDNNLTEMVRPGNERYILTYDANSNLKTITDPENQVTTLTYNGQGNITERRNNLGKTWNYTYDGNGYLESVIMPNDGGGTSGRPTWTYDNDELGRRVSVTDPNNNTWNYTYDAEDRVVRIDYPDATKAEFRFNNDGLMIWAKDQSNVRTDFRYNSALQLTETVDSANVGATLRRTQYRYDNFGRLSRLTNARSQDTVYTYDNLNRTTNVSYPGNLISESFTYDAIGNVLTHRKGDNTVITYAYDDDNRLERISHPSLSPAITYSYDDNDRRTSMTDETGTTNWTYNKKGQILTVATPLTGTLEYDYDGIGRLETITDPEDIVTTYTYTDRNLMASVNQDGQTISYTYDQNGNLSGKTLPNGVNCNMNYDELNRLTRVEYAQGMNAPFFSEDYTMDNVGNLKRNISRTNSGTEVLRYTYDRLYRVTEVEKREGSTFVPSETFAYDAQDNITSFNGQTFNHNSIDQLTSALSSTINYDGNGSADQIQGSNNRTITTNYADLPTEIKNGATPIGSYTYNGDRQRISRTVPFLSTQRTYRYLWAGSEVFKEYDQNGNTRASYILGVGREAIKNANDGWRFYVTDRLGSTRFLTDASGNITEAYTYTAYGETTTVQTTPPPGGTIGNFYYNPFLFTGQQFDESEGNYYLRNRYYTPAYGRFLVADPIRLQGGMNMYAYCNGNPINYVDPTGLDLETPLIMGDGKAFNRASNTKEGKLLILAVGGFGVSGGAALAGAPAAAATAAWNQFLTNPVIFGTGLEVIWGFSTGAELGPTSPYSAAPKIVDDVLGYTVKTSKGPVDFSAQVVVEGKRVLLKHFGVEPREVEKLTGLEREMFQGFTDIATYISKKYPNAEQVIFQGFRREGSSSAKPLKQINSSRNLDRYR